MVARAVTRVWLADRQQFPPQKQQLPRIPANEPIERRPLPDERRGVDETLDDDATIDIDKRDDIVPLRRGAAADAPEDEGFWTSHHFWKGVVTGVLGVVLVKMILDVQAPFGIDWYGY